MHALRRTTTVWGDPNASQGHDGQLLPAPQQQQPVEHAPQPQSGGASAWGGAGLPDKRPVRHPISTPSRLFLLPALRALARLAGPCHAAMFPHAVTSVRA